VCCFDSLWVVLWQPSLLLWCCAVLLFYCAVLLLMKTSCVTVQLMWQHLCPGRVSTTGLCLCVKQQSCACAAVMSL
jgi:hypothetical protein